MLEDELTELLRELMIASQAQSVEIRPNTEPHPLHSQYAKLGMGYVLCAVFHNPESPDALRSRAEILEVSARALRALLKRDEAEQWPRLKLPADSPDPRRLIVARIQQFLKGLVDSSELYQVALTCRGRLIASAYALDEIDESRLELLMRQLDIASQKSEGTRHGELVRDDLFARSFWYGAALFGFANKPYSVDFVRHRCKLVSRELANHLSMLDDDPNKPVKTAPVPPL